MVKRTQIELYVPELSGTKNVGHSLSLFNENKTAQKPSLQGLGSDFVTLDKMHQVEVPKGYTLPGEIGKFIQNIPNHKYSILVEGESGAGKTDLVFQLVNAFAALGKKIGVFSIEQGGVESADTRAVISRNVEEKNKPMIAVTGEAANGVETIKKIAKEFDVVVLDSYQKLKLPSTAFDDFRQEFPNVIWIVIFQQNTAGKTRGGIASVFDTNVRIVVHKGENPQKPFENNWAELTKNRGNNLTVKYMVSDKKTITYSGEPTKN